MPTVNEPADPFTFAALARADRVRERLEQEERDRELMAERVAMPAVDPDTVRIMRQVQAAQHARLERDLRLLSSMPESTIGEGPVAMSAPTHTQELGSRRRLRSAPRPPAPNGLAEVLQPDARVLHDSTREPTDITTMTDTDRIAWLEEKLEQAKLIINRRDAELEYIRRRVRDLYAGQYMPSPSAVLTALHPYPEQLPISQELG